MGGAGVGTGNCRGTGDWRGPWGGWVYTVGRAGARGGTQDSGGGHIEGGVNSAHICHIPPPASATPRVWGAASTRPSRTWFGGSWFGALFAGRGSGYGLAPFRLFTFYI